MSTVPFRGGCGTCCGSQSSSLAFFCQRIDFVGLRLCLRKLCDVLAFKAVNIHPGGSLTFLVKLFVRKIYLFLIVHTCMWVCSVDRFSQVYWFQCSLLVSRRHARLQVPLVIGSSIPGVFLPQYQQAVPSTRLHTYFSLRGKEPLQTWPDKPGWLRDLVSVWSIALDTFFFLAVFVEDKRKETVHS